MRPLVGCASLQHRAIVLAEQKSEEQRLCCWTSRSEIDLVYLYLLFASYVVVFTFEECVRCVSRV